MGYMAFKDVDDRIVVQPVGHDLLGNEVPGTCDLSTAFRRAKVLAGWKKEIPTKPFRSPERW